MILIYSTTVLCDTTITWFSHQIYVIDIDLFDAVDTYEDVDIAYVNR